MVEQSARLRRLKFETDPSPNARELQPVLDAQGRIAGFFTWDKTYPMTRAVNRLMPLIGSVAVALIGFAGFALRQLERTRAELAASEKLARRAADLRPRKAPAPSSPSKARSTRFRAIKNSFSANCRAR